MLYQYQGRGGEWARLVAEIVPDFCTAQDDPVPGREEEYSLVMGYRIHLAQEQERNLDRAVRLQEKRVDWDRRQAASALALAADAPLDVVHRHRIRTLGVSVFALGQILREQGSPDCIEAYHETVGYVQRIDDTAAEASVHFNLGHAYRDLAVIRDPDAAEAAYKQALKLFHPDDAFGRSSAIHQIGVVYHERFKEAQERSAPLDTQQAHAQTAQRYYQQALALCPSTAITNLGPMHNQLGLLYMNVGQTEKARQHYEQAADYYERSGNRHGAGTTRFNLGLMYREAAGREAPSARQGDLLRRARVYAQAALSDFQSFQGRAADLEAKAQKLIELIEVIEAALAILAGVRRVG